MNESKLFTPVKIGPLTLRNRTIRAAAFEGMCMGNAPTDLLYNYHRSVARGGIGMTTLAYASVTRDGLSFPDHRCDPQRGRSGLDSDRSLRKYVAQSHLRLPSGGGIVWNQYLFTYISARIKA